MPEGTCKICGRKYYGWALQNPGPHICECGGTIEIKDAEKSKKVTPIRSQDNNY